MQFTGKITFISPEEKVGQNQTAKITVVLEETESQYPNSISFDLLGDKIEMIKPFSVGKVVEVSLNSKCNEYNGKYYNSIRAWKINAKEGGSSSSQSGSSSQSQDDDLPF